MIVRGEWKLNPNSGGWWKLCEKMVKRCIGKDRQTLILIDSLTTWLKNNQYNYTYFRFAHWSKPIRKARPALGECITKSYGIGSRKIYTPSERWIRKLKQSAKSVWFHRWIDFHVVVTVYWSFGMFMSFSIFSSISLLAVFSSRILCVRFSPYVCMSVSECVLCGILFPWLYNILLSSTLFFALSLSIGECKTLKVDRNGQC